MRTACGDRASGAPAAWRNVQRVRPDPALTSRAESARMNLLIFVLLRIATYYSDRDVKAIPVVLGMQ